MPQASVVGGGDSDEPIVNRPCIAVHCVAGLGRAPVLVAIALIEAGMKFEDAVEMIRGKCLLVHMFVSCWCKTLYFAQMFDVVRSMPNSCSICLPTSRRRFSSSPAVARKRMVVWLPDSRKETAAYHWPDSRYSIRAQGQHRLLLVFLLSFFLLYLISNLSFSWPSFVLVVECFTRSMTKFISSSALRFRCPQRMSCV